MNAAFAFVGAFLTGYAQGSGKISWWLASFFMFCLGLILSDTRHRRG